MNDSSKLKNVPNADFSGASDLSGTGGDVPLASSALSQADKIRLTRNLMQKLLVSLDNLGKTVLNATEISELSRDGSLSGDEPSSASGEGVSAVDDVEEVKSTHGLNGDEEDHLDVRLRQHPPVEASDLDDVALEDFKSDFHIDESGLNDFSLEDVLAEDAKSDKLDSGSIAIARDDADPTSSREEVSKSADVGVSDSSPVDGDGKPSLSGGVDGSVLGSVDKKSSTPVAQADDSDRFADDASTESGSPPELVSRSGVDDYKGYDLSQVSIVSSVLRDKVDRELFQKFRDNARMALVDRLPPFSASATNSESLGALRSSVEGGDSLVVALTREAPLLSVAISRGIDSKKVLPAPLSRSDFYITYKSGGVLGSAKEILRDETASRDCGVYSVLPVLSIEDERGVFSTTLRESSSEAKQSDYRILTSVLSKDLADRENFPGDDLALERVLLHTSLPLMIHPETFNNLSESILSILTGQLGLERGVAERQVKNAMPVLMAFKDARELMPFAWLQYHVLANCSAKLGPLQATWMASKMGLDLNSTAALVSAAEAARGAKSSYLDEDLRSIVTFNKDFESDFAASLGESAPQVAKAVTDRALDTIGAIKSLSHLDSGDVLNAVRDQVVALRGKKEDLSSRELVASQEASSGVPQELLDRALDCFDELLDFVDCIRSYLSSSANSAIKDGSVDLDAVNARFSEDVWRLEEGVRDLNSTLEKMGDSGEIKELKALEEVSRGLSDVEDNVSNLAKSVNERYLEDGVVDESVDGAQLARAQKSRPYLESIADSIQRIQLYLSGYRPENTREEVLSPGFVEDIARLSEHARRMRFIISKLSGDPDKVDYIRKELYIVDRELEAMEEILDLPRLTSLHSDVNPISREAIKNSQSSRLSDEVVQEIIEKDPNVLNGVYRSSNATMQEVMSKFQSSMSNSAICYVVSRNLDLLQESNPDFLSALEFFESLGPQAKDLLAHSLLKLQLDSVVWGDDMSENPDKSNDPEFLLEVFGSIGLEFDNGELHDTRFSTKDMKLAILYNIAKSLDGLHNLLALQRVFDSVPLEAIASSPMVNMNFLRVGLEKGVANSMLVNSLHRAGMSLENQLQETEIYKPGDSPSRTEDGPHQCLARLYILTQNPRLQEGLGESVRQRLGDVDATLRSALAMGGDDLFCRQFLPIYEDLVNDVGDGSLEEVLGGHKVQDLLLSVDEFLWSDSRALEEQNIKDSPPPGTSILEINIQDDQVSNDIVEDLMLSDSTLAGKDVLTEKVVSIDRMDIGEGSVESRAATSRARPTLPELGTMPHSVNRQSMPSNDVAGEEGAQVSF